MTRDPSHKPVAEDLSLRVQPVRQSWRSSLAWFQTKTAAAILLLLGVLFASVVYLLVRGVPPFPRVRASFPGPPQLDAQIAAAQERLRVNPQDIGALTELGTLHFEKGKDFYPDAVNELEDARDLGALDPRIFYCLGIMYQELGLYPFALEEYKRFLRHYPDDKEIRMLAAKLLYRRGSYPEAVAEYERLKFHFPNDPLVEENLGLSLWGAKLADRAVDSFNALKAMGPEAAKRAEFYLGQLALDQARYESALEHLLQCQAPDGAPGFGIAPEKVHAALGTAYQKLGRLQEAKTAWERVLGESSADVKAQAALKDVNRRLSAKGKARPKRP